MNDVDVLVSPAERVPSCCISSIPPEVLSKILILASEQPQANVHNLPVYLTQICSSWRLLALDTPELWSYVRLIFNEKSAQSTSAIIQFADQWLAKGRRGRLALHIHMGFSFDEDNLSDLAPIGRLLATRARDWQKLTLAHCPETVTDYFIARMAENSLPSLEEVELHAYASIWCTRFDALVSAPRLHTIRFQTSRTPSAQHNLTLLFLPWRQLRSFSISAPVSERECLGILRQCPELTSLEASVISDGMASHGSQAPAIILPSLSRLKLTANVTLGRSTSNIESFLDTLHLPALRELDLYFIGNDRWSPLVSRFWDGHAAQLCTLRLSKLKSRSDLYSFFRTMPNLASLEISSPQLRLTAPDFEALRVERLLPALTHLNVPLGLAPGSLAVETVRSAVALLEARATVCKDTGVELARPVHVRLTDCTQLDDGKRTLSEADPLAMGVELERLRALRAEGMDIQLKVKGYDVVVPGTPHY
ncbi:hypothetical protein DFH08DRAFT_833085 [Mycena albidolilacea]|uniref:F-box domain-containing protein n=1 Tax=Mycena albidolilacea TaxID=1033008 RepID=A0AAD7F709_9AGAR|nr:hypothetical protein DFH08DRAFT_833085 [Mycena albidolilacea]